MSQHRIAESRNPGTTARNTFIASSAARRWRCSAGWSCCRSWSASFSPRSASIRGISSNSVQRLIEHVWNMGFDAVRWLWRYFLLGAVIVRADLASGPPGQGAARAVSAPATMACKPLIPSVKSGIGASLLIRASALVAAHRVDRARNDPSRSRADRRRDAAGGAGAAESGRDRHSRSAHWDHFGPFWPCHCRRFGLAVAAVLRLAAGDE